jgi:hypothetical protein
MRNRTNVLDGQHATTDRPGSQGTTAKQPSGREAAFYA